MFRFQFIRLITKTFKKAIKHSDKIVSTPYLFILGVTFMSNQKQLFQLQNILDTLVEATDHFSKLVKDKELNQSIFMLGSIVEGYQAINNMFSTSEQQSFKQYTDKLERSLLLIAQQLERGNFIKVSEIIQFSFRPQLVKLNQAFINIYGDQQKEKITAIGVFHSWANPRKFYTEDRVHAMVKESEKQDARLYFFTSVDIDFEQKQINADTFQNNLWKRITVPFPDVINNVGGGRQSHTERKLRREVPFTSFHVGNKYTLPKRMVKYKKFAELLVPFKVCTTENVIDNFLESNNRAVFKALGSNRGENIYFITKKGNRYVILDQKKERILNTDAFNNFVQHTILREKGNYIIQRYIHTRTKEDEPYHFRAHVQKNGEGKWILTHIYPRIGNKKSNLSNISTEGRVEDFPLFLQKEFGKEQGTKYKKRILQLSLDVAWHLDKLYGLNLDELGLDFAIDETGRIWMHEANNGPQTAYHEKKRAVQTIAYAKYIAKNGIMYTDTISRRAAIKGQFNAKTTDLPFVESDHRPYIGMLIGKQTNDKLTIALAQVAEESDVHFYYFTPKDIDFNRGLIKGFFYENKTWTPKVTEYPDIIIDRIKMRGNKDAQMMYDELEDIPFTNEWPVHIKKRSEIYDHLRSNMEIANALCDYQKVKRPRHVFQFIEKYGKVILKPENTSFGNVIYSIEQLNNGNYFVVNGTRRKEYREIQLRNLIKDLMKTREFIVQKDSRAQIVDEKLPDIHIHLMKNENNEWNFISLYARIGRVLDDDSIEYIKKDLTVFMEEKYGTAYIKGMEKQIKKLALTVTSILEACSDSVTEIALNIAIDNTHEFSLLDADPNGPQSEYNEKHHANAIVKYAESLVKE